jgi:hypothetical protein
MRCYFMRKGHIAGVEAIPGLPDDETIKQAWALFEEKQKSHGYDGFEVWDLARVVFQYPPPTDEKIQATQWSHYGIAAESNQRPISLPAESITMNPSGGVFEYLSRIIAIL